MASTISFGDANSGIQAGIINGPVNAEFHPPLGILSGNGSTRPALTMSLPQNDPKLHHIRRPSYPSLAIETLSSERNCSIISTRNALYQVLGLRSSAWAVLGKCERSVDMDS